jgi:hypothetical protein
LPVTLASHAAPGCATARVRAGPSTGERGRIPFRHLTPQLHQAFAPPRDVDPRAAAITEPAHQPATHSPSKFSLVIATMPRSRK